jgi:hypothetical protein
MPASSRRITPADVAPRDVYAAERKARKSALVAIKKARRIEVGPFATFYFENYDTMLGQVQEMLHIEKGGDEQVQGELDAYNPLIPQGNELIATMMLEIEDAARRHNTLLRLGHIEETVFMEVDGSRIIATPTEYEDRTTEDGKTSSVHWLRFAFTPEQKAAFRDTSKQVILGIAHRNYGHMAVISPEAREVLAGDFG